MEKYAIACGNCYDSLGDKEKALKWISAYEAKELENKSNKVLEFKAQGVI